MLKKESSYVIHVPPGWLLAGQVDTITDEHVTFVDALYIEQVDSGRSPLSVAQENDLKSWSSTHWIGTLIVRRDAILLSIELPKKISTRQLSPQMKSLDRAGGKK